MRILGIGYEQRELAVQWALAKEPDVVQTWLSWDSQYPVASRNGVLREAHNFKPDLAVVWTRVDPLIAGIADDLEERGIPVVGPRKLGANLEASKLYAYKFALENGILVPDTEFFSNPQDSTSALVRCYESGRPLPVLKPDGLPPTKGICLPKTIGEALTHLGFLQAHYGPVHLHQRRIDGHDFSLMVLADGESYSLLPSTRICKFASQGGRPANNEGAFSPAPELKTGITSRIVEEIVGPTLAGMRKLGQPYRGFLMFDGILGDDDKIYLLDINCQLAYPETETLLARVSNLPQLLAAAAFGRLDATPVELNDKASVCVVVMASTPVNPSTLVTGVKEAKATGCLVFPIGVTSSGPAAKLLGNTARVALVVGTGKTLAEARDLAYTGVGCISFEGMWFNPDIARNF